MKVDSTIYISDELPAADFGFAGKGPKGKAPGAAPPPSAGDGQKPKSKLGLIIGVIVVGVLLFSMVLCGIVGLAYTKGWGPFAPADGGTESYEAPTEPPADAAPAP